MGKSKSFIFISLLVILAIFPVRFADAQTFTLTPLTAQADTARTTKEVDYTFLITNTGAVTDTFEISVLAANWLTELSSSQTVIASLGSSSITVTVTVHPNAVLGDTDDFTTEVKNQTGVVNKLAYISTAIGYPSLPYSENFNTGSDLPIGWGTFSSGYYDIVWGKNASNVSVAPDTFRISTYLVFPPLPPLQSYEISFGENSIGACGLTSRHVFCASYKNPESGYQELTFPEPCQAGVETITFYAVNTNPKDTLWIALFYEGYNEDEWVIDDVLVAIAVDIELESPFRNAPVRKNSFAFIDDFSHFLDSELSTSWSVSEGSFTHGSGFITANSSATIELKSAIDFSEGFKARTDHRNTVNEPTVTLLPDKIKIDFVTGQTLSQVTIKNEDVFSISESIETPRLFHFDVSDSNSITRDMFDAVSSISSQSGDLLLEQTVGTKQPIFSRGTFNGKNSILFDGSNDFLEIPDINEQASLYTIFVVFKPIDFNRNDYLLSFRVTANAEWSLQPYSIDALPETSESVYGFRQFIQNIPGSGLYLDPIDQPVGQIMNYVVGFKEANIYLDGVLQPNSAAFFEEEARDFYFASRLGNPGSTYGVELAEIICYPSVLSNNDINEINWNLASKWAIGNVNKIPSGGVFRPDSIPNLELWLDASDTASVTSISGQVSAWLDKSGNSNDATQSIEINKPELMQESEHFNGNPYISFQNDVERLDISLNPITNSATLFAAFISDDPSGPDHGLISISNNFNFGYSSNFLISHDASGVENLISHSTATIKLVVFSRDYSSNEGYVESYEKLPIPISSTKTMVGNDVSVGNYIGAFNTSENFEGKVSEICFYDRKLTRGEMDQVIGYFRQKYTRWVTPNNLNNFELWYDISDSTLLTYSGLDKVSLISDNHHLGLDATQGTGTNQPDYLRDVLGGVDVISFDGSNDFMNHSYTVNTGQQTVVSYALFGDLAGGLDGLYSIEDGMNIYLDSGGNLFTRETSGETDLSVAIPNTTGFHSVVHVRDFDLGVSRTTVDGGIQVSVITPGPTPTSDSVLGSSSVSDRYFFGYVAELFLYDRELNEVEIKFVTDYLVQKYE